jgi:SAM-dependent methyltransferase
VSSRPDTLVGAKHHAVSPARCPACAAPLPATPAIRGRDRLHGTPGAFTVAICDACGSGLTFPVVGEQALAAFYPSDYNAYALPPNPVMRAAATALFRWRYWRALRRAPLATLLCRPPGRLLDVGGGRGDLGVVLRPHGWRVTLIDPAAAACAEARERGVDSYAGTLTSLPDRVDGPFDAVVFQHSLEHVVDPAADLVVACGLLAEGGLVIVTLPNFASWQRRRFGEDWFHLDLPRHRAHLTSGGLRALLQRTGFERVEVTTSTSADGLPMSVHYRLRGRPPRGAARYAMTAATLLAAPFTAGSNAVAGHGDFLHAVAQRSSAASTSRQ